jgi:L-ribulokinase
MAPTFAIGLDYGTNSVRALIVNVQTGEEVGTCVFPYPSGEQGILLDAADPDLARQHPGDYLAGAEASIRGALAEAQRHPDFDPSRVIGIGVDTTGSTPLPVDAEGRPLAFNERFRNNLNAQAWLWKDHTSHAEAAEITEKARALRPHYIAKYGGTYSAEWFWAKILHCRRVDPEVFEAAYTWVEIADWIPAVLTSTEHPARLRRSICAAGHKAFFNPEWGGYPDEAFLEAIDPALVRVRRTLPDRAYNVSQPAGQLTPEWAERLGLPAGIPVAVGAFDAHLGAVGAGIAPGVLVKIIGTSTCDIMIAPGDQPLADIPGLCGIVRDSVLPGYYGLEAGQSAVGDIFNWFVQVVRPEGHDHATLTAAAARLRPGESGLLALDWHNGNRTVLVDQRLTGLIVGLTLRSSPAEIYRALMEATAFGARVIMERFEAYGVPVKRVLACGGIPPKNPLLMQIYADVMGRRIELARSELTCALGAAISGAVVAGSQRGGYDRFDEAIQAMTGVRAEAYDPIPRHQRVYEELFALYKNLHDALGVLGSQMDLYPVMKRLLEIRDQVWHSRG